VTHVPIDTILAAVANHYGLARDDFVGTASRKRHITTPRHVAMWLAKRLTIMSYDAIAEAMGVVDHTSVMYACRKVARWHRDGNADTDTLLATLQG
jgi:chromosomal replication initiator protein